MGPPTIVRGRACVRRNSFLIHDNELYQKGCKKIKQNLNFWGLPVNFRMITAGLLCTQ